MAAFPRSSGERLSFSYRALHNLARAAVTASRIQQKLVFTKGVRRNSRERVVLFPADGESQEGCSSGAVPGRCLARRGSAIRSAKPFARFFLGCYLIRRGKCLMSPISSPVIAFELPVLRNNRKLLGRPCNRFESRLIF